MEPVDRSCGGPPGAHGVRRIYSRLLGCEANVDQGRAQVGDEHFVGHGRVSVNRARGVDRAEHEAAAKNYLGQEAHVVDAEDGWVFGARDIQEIATVLVVFPAVEVEADVGHEHLAVAFVPAAPLEVVVPQQQFEAESDADADHELPLVRRRPVGPHEAKPDEDGAHHVHREARRLSCLAPVRAAHRLEGRVDAHARVNGGGQFVEGAEHAQGALSQRYATDRVTRLGHLGEVRGRLAA
mmetsp:Transcript_37944/g.84797  ORF Transcript_37944/g.84797 Transcript_37944/m.84797 type:complete len:239 (-) Transcript_37944:778-1494(-)